MFFSLKVKIDVKLCISTAEPTGGKKKKTKQRIEQNM